MKNAGLLELSDVANTEWRKSQSEFFGHLRDSISDIYRGTCSITPPLYKQGWPRPSHRVNNKKRSSVSASVIDSFVLPTAKK